MKTFDFSSYIVLYNLVAGVLLVLASERIASVAATVGRYGSLAEPYMRTTVRAFGGGVAILSGSIYLLVHILGIGTN